MGALRFVLRGVAASLGFFGVLRLNWIEAHVVLPLTRVQGDVAMRLFGAPALPVSVTIACSGADAMALCLGAILAYPVRWRTRVAGATAGAALIVGLNTLRIATLARAAASPAWFDALHLYVWPALLTLTIAGYVLGWMRVADRWQTQGETASALPEPIRAGYASPPSVDPRLVPQPSRRFIGLTVAFLLIFVAASPLYLESRTVLALAAFVARTAAAILGAMGIGAYAAASVLYTSRGGFLVTQECISTPLIPVYLAAVCTYSTTWRRLVVGMAATVPLFLALGVVRLLMVALPGVISSPLFFVHAFYQLLLGAVVVFLAALWRRGGRRAIGPALAGVAVGVLFMALLGPFYTRAITLHAAAPLDDPQGAIAFLPAFQIGLYLALWIAAFVAVGWTRFLAGLAALGLTQTTGILALHLLAAHAGLTAHVRDVRGWAVAGPVLIFAAVINVARPPR